MTVIRSDRRYRFDVEPVELWSALTRFEDYGRWWPWLGGFEAAAFAPGERWSCLVRPPLPYVLRFGIILEEVVAPRFVTVTVDGDLTGHAALEVTPVGAGSELHLVSALAPANAMLRGFARVAAPVVRYGHDWVLDTGLGQFRRSAW